MHGSKYRISKFYRHSFSKNLTLIAASPERRCLSAGPEGRSATARSAGRLTVQSHRATCRTQDVAMTSICAWVCRTAPDELCASLAHVPGLVREPHLQSIDWTSLTRLAHLPDSYYLRVMMLSDVPCSASRTEEFAWLRCPVGWVCHVRDAFTIDRRRQRVQPL